jgi:hypothetical protein
MIAVMAAPIRANVALELRPNTQTVEVGDVFRIGLYAVSDSDDVQLMSALSAILQWEADSFALLGNADDGPYEWLWSQFPDDSALDGLNDTWEDGNALYEALANFDEAAPASPDGLLVTSFEFRALDESPATALSLPASMGEWARTQVFGTESPADDITGDLGQAWVTIIPEPSALLLLLAGVTLSARRRVAR